MLNIYLFFKKYLKQDSFFYLVLPCLTPRPQTKLAFSILFYLVWPPRQQTCFLSLFGAVALRGGDRNRIYPCMHATSACCCVQQLHMYTCAAQIADVSALQDLLRSRPCNGGCPPRLPELQSLEHLWHCRLVGGCVWRPSSCVWVGCPATSQCWT